MSQPDVERAYESLFSEAVSLKHAWSEYQILFNHSNDRLELLSHCARQFFEVVQRTLLREIILAIARLSDPVKNRVQSNLPLRAILADPRVVARDDLRLRLTPIVDEFEACAKPFRKHRHKYIAHKDHSVALDANGMLLERLRKSEVTRAVALAESVFQTFEREALRKDVDLSVYTLGGAEALLRSLETSDRWRKRLAQAEG